MSVFMTNLLFKIYTFMIYFLITNAEIECRGGSVVHKRGKRAHS